MTFSLLLSFALLAQGTPAQKEGTAKSDQPSPQTITRMAQAVQKQILTLPNYGVFDWITFSFNGYNVILDGFASRPTLKDSAERVAKGVEGVAAVENRIQVISLSPNDDRIRTQAYVRIYGNNQLSRYNPNRGAPIFVSPARMAAGLTQDPPVGNHPIHIVVQNGNITLYGVVLNEGDKSIAGMMANQVTGAFAVTNNLNVEMSSNKETAAPPKGSER